MSFIHNIKLNYKLKILDDLFQNKRFHDIRDVLSEEKNKNPDIYIKLLKNYDNKYLKETNYSDFYEKKINWLISYDLETIGIINDFLSFYFSKFTSIKFRNEHYSEVLTNELSYFNNEFPEINFDQVVRNSSLFQTLVLLSTEYSLNFFQSSGAFFEAKKFNNFFTSPNLSNSYIYVLTNPFLLYQKYKKKFNSFEAALNELCNFSDNSNYHSNKENNKTLEDVRKSWNINVKSWTDPNVVSTFRGLVLRYEDLVKNTEETFVQILYHLKQSGEGIDVEYSFVKEYLDTLKLPSIEEIDLSNKEIKAIKSNLDSSILEEYNY